jgi:hypothetical protein
VTEETGGNSRRFFFAPAIPRRPCSFPFNTPSVVTPAGFWQSVTREKWQVIYMKREGQVARRWAIEKHSKFHAAVKVAVYSVLGYLVVFGMILLMQFSIIQK